MATRFLPNFDKGAESPICRIIFSIIAIFHKGLVQISFSLSSPTLRHYQIISPGGLLKEITIEEVKRGYSKIRNKGLAEALVYMHEVENWGGGVARYFTAMKNAGLPPPMAEERDGFFKVVFWRPRNTSQTTGADTTSKATTNTTTKTTTKVATTTNATAENSPETKLNGSSLSIFNLIEKQPAITAEELVVSTGLTLNGVRYHIKRLKATCGLRRVGGRKEGRWEFPK